MSWLEVEHISKIFNNRANRHTVLEDISLTLHQGEFVTLLGPSGCGKTTLLTIIAGFQKPTSGKAVMDGEVVTKPGPDRGFVFQNYALFPWMTVKENILYPMKQQKVPASEREKRLSQLLTMAGLEGKENLYPHQLSGGMKQRTAVIRSLACRPKILLMDEPLGAVDFQMRQNLQEELKAIFIRDQATVLMVTHDVEEAVYMSDRVIVMSNNKGEIIDDFRIGLKHPRDRKNPQYHQAIDYLMDALKLSQEDPQLRTGAEEHLADVKIAL